MKTFCGIKGAEQGCSRDSEFNSVEDLSMLKEVCGQSRLWGVMHFTASISAAEELCSDLSTLAMDFHDSQSRQHVDKFILQAALHTQEQDFPGRKDHTSLGSAEDAA